MSKLKTGNPQILGIISLVPARRRLFLDVHTALFARCLLTLSLAPVCKIISTLQLFGQSGHLAHRKRLTLCQTITCKNIVLCKFLASLVSLWSCLLKRPEWFWAGDHWCTNVTHLSLLTCHTLSHTTFEMSHIVTYEMLLVVICHLSNWSNMTCRMQNFFIPHSF